MAEEQLQIEKVKDLIRFEDAMIQFIEEFETEPSKALSECVGKVIVRSLSRRTEFDLFSSPPENPKPL
jgi:hypothetical protein